MTERTIHSPLSATLAGLPLHRLIDEISIFPTTGKALFSGHLPMDAALSIERANRLPWDANPKGAHAQFCDGTCDQTPGANCPKRPVDMNFELPLQRPFSDDEVAEMGQNLLAGMKANFESMDEAERATDPRRIELAEWWRETAEAEIDQTVDKAIEYSATDLVDIGRSMARAAGRDVSEAHAAELAVAFYALGKVSRIMGAIERGELPNMDSWLDLGIYARMAQRIRQVGSWPGVNLHDTHKEAR